VNTIQIAATTVPDNDTFQTGWNKRHWRFLQRVPPAHATEIIMKSLADEVKPILARSQKFDPAELRERIPQIHRWEKDKGGMQYDEKAVYLIVGRKMPRRQNPAKRQKSSKRRRSSSSSTLTWKLYTGCTSRLIQRMLQHRHNLRRRRAGGARLENDIYATDVLGPDSEVSCSQPCDHSFFTVELPF
jgi:hypothetical protein